MTTRRTMMTRGAAVVAALAASPALAQEDPLRVAFGDIASVESLNLLIAMERADDIQIFVEELLRTWEDINENPAIVGELREQYGLLPDLPDEAASEAVPYYTEAVENGIYPSDGGSPQNAEDDIAFLAAAGQVEQPEGGVDASDYWDFGPLEAARAAN